MLTMKDPIQLALNDLVVNSALFSEHKTSISHNFNEEDVHVGVVIGIGTFSRVNEIVSIHGSRKTPSVEINTKNTSFNKQFGNLQRLGHSQYVTKRLRNELFGSDRLTASIDIAVEAKILALLAHENIMKICGTSGIPGDFNFFIVLEKLETTLVEKIEEWKNEMRSYNGFFGIKEQKKIAAQALWNERLIVASEISKALEYLHSQNIVYRDLKPANVAFDEKGTTKLIDFGLAKELKSMHQVASDEYCITTRTGTLRYMAPEVALGKPYGTPADIFSFAILFWQILNLRTPFSSLNTEMHGRHVYIKEKRLHISSSWPSQVKKLVKECWSHKACDRPPASRFSNSMKSEVNIYP